MSAGSLGAGYQSISHGPTNSVLDISGLRVGHFHKEEGGYLTGTTVIIFDRGATTAVEVRGGGPGTRETDALAPWNLIDSVDALMFSGGSAYGLDAASGVMAYLEDRSQGYSVGLAEGEVVPIVPGAVIFDLGRGGNFRARPDGSFGRAAAESASAEGVEWGSVGAGMGAVSGGVKGGVGSASAVLSNGTVVGAMVVVNSRGSIFSPTTGIPYEIDQEINGEFEHYRRALMKRLPAPRSAQSTGSALNTTVGAVVTDIPLSKAECLKFAQVAHDGLARTVRPAHTYFDGDTIFGVSVPGVPNPPGEPEGRPSKAELCEVFEIGAGCLARAIVHAVLGARGKKGFKGVLD